MKHITKVHVPSALISQTVNSLCSYGEHGCEGLVFWLGRVEDATCYVEKVLTPPQQSLKSEDGVGYFITSETLLNLNKFLASSGLRLIAQVHSHPGTAYHSAADDRYCIVTVEGGLSLVVPNFGFGPTNLHCWAIYRLSQGRWEELSSRSVRALFVTECGEEERQSGVMSIVRKLFT
jgi:proteasome lid subunit RPN8/RPN11